MKFACISLLLATATGAAHGQLISSRSKRRKQERKRALSDSVGDFSISKSIPSATLDVNSARTSGTETVRGKRVLGKAGKGSTGIDFDSKQWKIPDVELKHIDEGYLGDYEVTNTGDADVVQFDDRYKFIGAPFVFDLGSFGSLTRRLGITIVLAEIRTIWYELAPIVEQNNGVIMKSIGDSLFMYFEKVSDGLAGTRAMYLALVARWKDKVALACDGGSPQEWCDGATDEDERKRFFNTAAMGGDYGEVILIGDENSVDAYGAPVNNAFFAGEEEAKHGETIIGEGALQSLLEEAGQATGDYCVEFGNIPWTNDQFGIDHLIVISFGFFCYYTVCFDEECKIPDDE